MEVYVKIDKQFLVEELYRLKKHIPTEETEAKEVLKEILDYVNSATPIEANRLPKMKGLRG